MELRHLRYFVAVAEELHFRRAAERLYVAQPAISEQIRKLEVELGVGLLNRTHHKVSLTEAGAALLAEARRVLQQVEIARLAAQEARNRATIRLRIGYTPVSLPTSVTRALQRLAASMPGLAATLEPAFGPELIAGVRDERLDAAIVSLPAPTGGLRATHLGQEKAVAVLPLSHRHALRPAIRLEQLAPERIVLLPREASRPFYDAVLAACRRAALSPSLIETRGTCVEPSLLAVASGAGIGVLPESVADRYSTPRRPVRADRRRAARCLDGHRDSPRQHAPADGGVSARCDPGPPRPAPESLWNSCRDGWLIDWRTNVLMHELAANAPLGKHLADDAIQADADRPGERFDRSLPGGNDVPSHEQHRAP